MDFLKSEIFIFYRFVNVEHVAPWLFVKSQNKKTNPTDVYTNACSEWRLVVSSQWFWWVHNGRSLRYGRETPRAKRKFGRQIATAIWQNYKLSKTNARTGFQYRIYEGIKRSVAANSDTYSVD